MKDFYKRREQVTIEDIKKAYNGNGDFFPNVYYTFGLVDNFFDKEFYEIREKYLAGKLSYVKKYIKKNINSTNIRSKNNAKMFRYILENVRNFKEMVFDISEKNINIHEERVNILANYYIINGDLPRLKEKCGSVLGNIKKLYEKEDFPFNIYYKLCIIDDIFDQEFYFLRDKYVRGDFYYIYLYINNSSCDLELSVPAKNNLNMIKYMMENNISILELKQELQKNGSQLKCNIITEEIINNILDFYKIYKRLPNVNEKYFHENILYIKKNYRSYLKNSHIFPNLYYKLGDIDGIFNDEFYNVREKYIRGDIKYVRNYIEENNSSLVPETESNVLIFKDLLNEKIYHGCYYKL